jgi:hypothetical protein
MAPLMVSGADFENEGDEKIYWVGGKNAPKMRFFGNGKLL